MRSFKPSLMCALLATAGSGAQDMGSLEPTYDSPRLSFDVAGGAALPVGNLDDRYNAGWLLSGGVRYNFSRWVGAKAEYQFKSIYGSATLLDFDLDAHQYVHTFGLLGTVSTGRTRGLNGYALAGPAAVYRRVTVSEYLGTSVAPYCDPYLFFCYPAPVAVSNVLGSRSEWSLGLTGGLGAEYIIQEGGSVFVEGRYDYVFGQSYEAADQSVDSSGAYIPLMLGIRWSI